MTLNFAQLLSHLLETEKKYSDVIMPLSFICMTSSVDQVAEMLKQKIGSKNCRMFVRGRKAFWETPSDVQRLTKGFQFGDSQNKKNLDSKIVVLTQEIQTPNRNWIFIHLDKSQEKSQNFSSIGQTDPKFFKLKSAVGQIDSQV